MHGYTTAFTVSAALLGAAGVVAALSIRASRHDLKLTVEPISPELFADEAVAVAEAI